jgi:hypothetical protein
MKTAHSFTRLAVAASLVFVGWGCQTGESYATSVTLTGTGAGDLGGAAVGLYADSHHPRRVHLIDGPTVIQDGPTVLQQSPQVVYVTPTPVVRVVPRWSFYWSSGGYRPHRYHSRTYGRHRYARRSYHHPRARHGRWSHRRGRR